MSPLAELADELFDLVLARFPIGASFAGVPGHDDRLTDYSRPAEEAFAASVAGLAARAAAVPDEDLSTTDRITKRTIAHEAAVLAGQIEGRWIEFTVSDYLLTPVAGLLSALHDVPLNDDLPKRLAALPEFLATVAQRQRDGLAAGLTPLTHLVQAAIANLDVRLATVDTFVRSEACRPVVTSLVAPAIAEYRDFLATEVLPHGRDTEHAGLCWLPGGSERYATAVRAHTTTSLTPDELHQMGLDVLADLAHDYVELGRRVFGTDELPEIFRRLRDDPALRWSNAEEMIAAATATVRRAERAAPDWFHQVPSTVCDVRAFPPSTSTLPGAYRHGSLDGSRPGTFHVNTDRPAETPRHQIEALAFHEAVPGHHFEVTGAETRTDLPLLRRTASVSAYREGWGLYSERLADEMGLYTDDLARLGMLMMDSTRAGRLVVDTGLHAQGWSRQRGIDYLLANTPMAPHHVESEVDRYLAVPGQALAYMVGRLEIQRLRRKAEAALGDRFDVRDFHAVVLSEGAVPLSVLDELITEWIDRVSGRA
ncbi:DUF885 family protein [Kutzneria buriramensis]|uniref:Uncharacterized protein (DUF885 family) n=1 Tax=Kutzneria buriramensis TaxID=1045776 RepID=A0A3E0I6C3_9PSEU|nr:DUF885 domain-containing protein [Kutzneria buriramensis]REH54160.1 uncharacterized protein (DUF885 family) [Kutzneria buriramensis]